MNFDQSGLPPAQLIQDAYNYSYAYVMGTADEEMRGFEKRLAMAIRQNLASVNAQKNSGRMSEEQYKQALRQIEAMRQHNLRDAPQRIREGLQAAFADTHLRQAKELFVSSEKASHEAVAAILLLGCVRSPRDHKDVEENFGPIVAGIVSDMMHAKAYPVQTAKTIAASSDDVKRIQQALTIVSLDDISEQVDDMRREHPDGILRFPEAHEKRVFETSDAAWGVDKKLDSRLISAFNRAAEKVGSPFRMDRAAAGDLILVQQKPPAPKPPKPPAQIAPPAPKKPPNNNGGIGPDLF